MSTQTYQADDPEAKPFEDLRKANEEATRASRAGETPELPDKPATKE